MEEIVFKKHNLTVNGTSEGKSAPHDFFESLTDTAYFLKEDNSIESNFTTLSSSDIQNTPASINITIIPLQNQTHKNLTLSNNFKIEETNSTFLNDTSRVTRQKVQDNKDDDDNNDVDNGTKEDENKSKEGDNKDLEKEEQVDDSSEEEGNMVTGLLGSLLGSLSKPDGSIDLEAITSLLGSLSTQNTDGSYDFSGLTELLMGFFGGGEDGGGGSDIAGFLGGLVGAVLKGSAQNPPGGAPPSEDADSPQAGGLDSGGFLGGLLQGVFAGSGGLSNSSSGISGGSSNSSGGGGGGGNNGVNSN
ncbi:unnamed protein product [Brassicogethes aeneus]|uniref:Uncharacterized protein n=1 Tax=Brassicogethes aeneus TaxID=1431903 RepID=A0A9P0BFI3_BRAAE|nr:unnamed protein product [Brassicogethes aeneus]